MKTVLVVAIAAIAILVAVLAGLSITGFFSKDVQPDGVIHWHPHLRIVIDGQEQVIPANIGLTPSKHYPVHTHETDGIIHLEGEYSELLVRLGTFFQIWNKTFSSECIFDYCTDTGELKMYVNGKLNYEFEKYPMQDKDEILIEYTSG
jgi:hypothetical protein